MSFTLLKNGFFFSLFVLFLLHLNCNAFQYKGVSDWHYLQIDIGAVIMGM